MAQFMRTFRKHRKVLLAILTLLAMLSFVFLPTILEIMQTGGRGRNPVVVKTTKYGSLTERQIDGLLRQRQRLYAFLRQLHDVVRTKGGRGDAVREAINSFGPSPASEEAAVDHWIHARRAEDLGFKVSEKSVNEYLASLTEGKAGNDDVRQILQRMRMSQGQLFESLRLELLSLRFAQAFWISLAAATPAQRWEYYQQLNRKAKIEAIPVAAAKFVDKVPPPSEEELRTFFEKYKERLPDPNSPEPGFREPHRVDIQYFKAAVETFLDPAAVTEQAIRDYYEKNKEQLYKDMLPEAPPSAASRSEASKPETPKPDQTAAPSPPATQSEKPATPKVEAAKPEAAKPEAPKPEAPKLEAPKLEAPKLEAPKLEAPKLDTPKPDVQKPDVQKGDTQKPDAQKPEASKPGAAKPEAQKSDAPKPDAHKQGTSAEVPGKTSFVARRSPFRLVSEPKASAPALPKLESPQTNVSAPKAAEAKTGTAPKAKAEPRAARPEPVLEPQPDSSATSKPEPAPPPKKPEPAAATKAEPTGARKAEPAKPAPVKYKPLADVQDEIRKTLAREAAEAKIRDVLRRLQDRLAQFETQWTIYDSLDPEKKASTPPPVRPDFVALAKEHRLTAAQTGLMSALQMSETDIGKSMVEGGKPFIETAFHKNALAFRPEVSHDSEGHRYLYWEVDDAPERVPAFDDAGVRQQVLDAWKVFHARDLATEEAERLAAEARKAGKSLAEVFAGHKEIEVLTPAPFTWLTFGNLPVWFRMRPPQYSEVAGISGAGGEFMRSIFALKPGEIGLAADQPKSKVYVVRVAEYSPSESVLWDMFVADDYRGYAMVARYDQMAAGSRWRDQIRDEVGLHWLREPFRGRGEIED